MITEIQTYTFQVDNYCYIFDKKNNRLTIVWNNKALSHEFPYDSSISFLTTLAELSENELLNLFCKNYFDLEKTKEETIKKFKEFANCNGFDCKPFVEEIKSISNVTNENEFIEELEDLMDDDDYSEELFNDGEFDSDDLAVIEYSLNKEETQAIEIFIKEIQPMLKAL